MAGVQKDGGGQPTATHIAQPGSGRPNVDFEVTEDNVIDLYIAFQQAAGRLRAHVPNLHNGLRIQEAWMGDPVSEWAQEQLNNSLVDGPNSMANVVTDTYNEFHATAEQLKKIAAEYGKTEELNTALMNQRGGQQ